MKAWFLHIIQTLLAHLITSLAEQLPTPSEEEIHSHYCGCFDCSYTRLIAPKAESMGVYTISNDE